MNLDLLVWVLEKGLPRDIETERSVLITILANWSLFEESDNIIKAKDFSAAENRWIYEAMTQIFFEKRLFNLNTLKDVLEENYKFGMLVGYFDKLAQASKLEDIKEGCKKIKTESLCREKIELAGEIIINCYEGNQPENILDEFYDSMKEED